jgi:hypothetical protein
MDIVSKVFLPVRFGILMSEMYQQVKGSIDIIVVLVHVLPFPPRRRVAALKQKRIGDPRMINAFNSAIGEGDATPGSSLHGG